MKKLEIKDIISHLDESQWKRFGDYIHSPFFKLPERIVLLYEHVNEKHKEFKTENITRNEIAAKVLKGSSSDTNIRRLFSDFNKAVEDFLEFTWFENDEAARSMALIISLREKNLKDHAVRKIKEEKKELLTKEPRLETYRNIHDLLEQEYLSEPVSEFHKFSEALQNSSDMLDVYYISRKLLLYQLMYSKELLNKESSYRRDMKPEIETFISRHAENIKQKYPDIYLKYLMLQILSSGSQDLILEYSGYLESTKGVLSKQQQADYYSDLYNYHTIRISRGEHSLRIPLLGLYKLLDEKDLLLDLSVMQIHTYTFKQIADTAFHLKELEWAEYFIKKYSPFIADENRANITNLEFAKLYDFKGERAKAKSFINKVDHRDYFHYLDSKMLLVCIHYDEDSFSEADMVIDSLNKYLRNSTELTKIHSDNTKRFIYYVKKLLKFKEAGAEEFDLAGLREELNEDKVPVYARNWLLERIEELFKK
ncbi:MAG: hypothetical protein IT281_09630 [Ignavibacteria bacterium]|nr:hypothetical protein [Ignavibacteria bacterium]